MHRTVVGAVVLTIALLLLVNVYAQGANSGGSGAIWTTRNDCGEESQDVNHFAVGDNVYINGKRFDPGTYSWTITGKPGGASSDPGQVVASGSLTVDPSGAFCFAAYVVQPDDDGEYQVKFGNKGDNYRVEGKDEDECDDDDNGDDDDNHCPPQSSKTPTLTNTPVPTNTSVPTATNTQVPPTNTPAATNTSVSTNTSVVPTNVPTKTPKATKTEGGPTVTNTLPAGPTATATATATPQPVIVIAAAPTVLSLTSPFCEMNAVVGSIADRSVRIALVWRNTKQLVVSWGNGETDVYDLTAEQPGVKLLDHTYPPDWPEAEILILAVKGGEKALCVADVDFVPPAPTAAVLQQDNAQNQEENQDINNLGSPLGETMTRVDWWLLCFAGILGFGILGLLIIFVRRL